MYNLVSMCVCVCVCVCVFTYMSYLRIVFSSLKEKAPKRAKKDLPCLANNFDIFNTNMKILGPPENPVILGEMAKQHGEYYLVKTLHIRD